MAKRVISAIMLFILYLLLGSLPLKLSILLQLDSQMNDMCNTKELVKPHCCEATLKHRAKCATKLLLRFIGKANQVKYSGRKKCPLIIQFENCERPRVRQNP